MITHYTPFRQIGEVPLSVWERERSRLASPISTQDLASCHAAAGPHSALALAVSLKESVLGRSAPGRNNALGLMTSNGARFLDFLSWGHGFEEWRRRIEDPSYKGGVYMPDDLPLNGYIATYVGGPECWRTRGVSCANGETWNGSMAGTIGTYLLQTINRINDWREIAVPPSNPYPKPPIYNLATDYARYGLTRAQADRIIGNRFEGRNGYSPLAFVFHIQEGTTAGSLAYWANTPGVQASSNWMVSRDGSILSIVDARHGPYTNGDVNRPSARGRALLQRIGGANPNLVSETVETEGMSGDPLTTPQLQALCWLVTDRLLVNDWTETNLYRHADFNGVTRSHCPGPYADQVIAALRANGQARPAFDGLPATVSSEDVLAWFPEASPTGPVTRLWLQAAAATGRWPSRISVDTVAPGSGRPWVRRFRFSDGLMIYADGSGKVWSEGAA